MRKILHIDMDCFYAAIEERENSGLRGKPVGVGGSSRRSVLTTANYEARRFGCRSAMPVFKALELCPQLIIMPVHIDLCRAEATRIRAIFRRFTEITDPLSLDEAYLDVSHLTSSPAPQFANLPQITAERAQPNLYPGNYEELLVEAWQRESSRPVRLLGVGFVSAIRRKIGSSTCFSLTSPI